LNIKECKKLHNSSLSLAKLDWHLPFNTTRMTFNFAPENFPSS
jgi:hypothetical protein